MKLSLIGLSILTAIALSPRSAHAQDTGASGNGGMDEIESLFSKDDDSENAPAKSTAGEAAKPPSDVAKTKVKDVTDLGKLQPFSDIAVIQKRYLPKSGRFEFYIAPSLVLNDAFFNDFGATARLGYFFSERYGIEANYVYLTTSAGAATNELANQGVTTQSFVTPQGFYGLDFKWEPVYGKMTWLNQKIIPFDFYLNFGLGLTPTNQNSSAPTFHLGAGEVFAHSKTGGLRWNFDWFMYNSASTVAGGSSALYHTLMFSIGWSFFFPEATYR